MDATPDGMQRLRNAAARDTGGIRDDVCAYVAGHLGAPGWRSAPSGIQMGHVPRRTAAAMSGPAVPRSGHRPACSPRAGGEGVAAPDGHHRGHAAFFEPDPQVLRLAIDLGGEPGSATRHAVGPPGPVRRGDRGAGAKRGPPWLVSRRKPFIHPCGVMLVISSQAKDGCRALWAAGRTRSAALPGRKEEV